MIGGGIDEGEAPIAAAVREVQEELGVTVPAGRLDTHAKIITNADTAEGSMRMSTYVFSLTLSTDEEQRIVPSDDITGVVRLSIDELRSLIINMSSLSGTFKGESNGKAFAFDWADWGLLYAPIHDIALTANRDVNRINELPKRITSTPRDEQ